MRKEENEGDRIDRRNGWVMRTRGKFFFIMCVRESVWEKVSNEIFMMEKFQRFSVFCCVKVDKVIVGHDVDVVNEDHTKSTDRKLPCMSFWCWFDGMNTQNRRNSSVKNFLVDISTWIDDNRDAVDGKLLNSRWQSRVEGGPTWWVDCRTCDFRRMAMPCSTSCLMTFAALELIFANFELRCALIVVWFFR